jgi:hypothetical protein
MPIKPGSILIAAQRWLELLPKHGETRTRATFATLPRYSDLTSTQYETAYEWLRSTGMLEADPGPVPPNHRVLTSAIETSDAVWLPNADEFADDPDLLPDDVAAAAEALGIDPSTAAAHIRSAWGKVDLDLRARIGSAGERALVELLEANAAATVDHVALWADGLGYDVSVRHGLQNGHLEVKSTTRRHRFTLHLSRNEFLVSQSDPAWLLVALRLDPDDLRLRSVATIDHRWLAQQMPTDTGDHGRWESCRVDVPIDSIVPGLGPFSSILDKNEALELFAWPGR